VIFYKTSLQQNLHRNHRTKVRQTKGIILQSAQHRQGNYPHPLIGPQPAIWYLPAVKHHQYENILLGDRGPCVNNMPRVVT